jgi:integrase
MLTALHDDNRLDLLREIRDGRLDMLTVYEAFQRRALHELPVAGTMRPLAATMKDWIESLMVPLEYSAKHVESLETSRRYFERADAKATVADLPRVLDELRDSLGRKHPRSFNLARAAALTFVRATLKRSHQIYAGVAAVEPRKLAKATKRTPLSLQQMTALFPNRDTEWLDGIAWGMATTGMHAKEYWGRWHVTADRVHIDGTKRSGRVRDVPLVLRPTVPKFNRRKFEDDLRERTRMITVYDLRRTYATWLEAAGIPRTRRRLYLGHGTSDVTDLYEWHEVTAFLSEDATKLRAFLAIPTISHTVGIVTAEGA